jgi:hypothetical protein
MFQSTYEMQITHTVITTSSDKTLTFNKIILQLMNSLAMFQPQIMPKTHRTLFSANLGTISSTWNL